MNDAIHQNNVIPKENSQKIDYMNDSELFDMLENIVSNPEEFKNNVLKKVEKKSLQKDQLFCEKCNTGDFIIEDTALGIMVCSGNDCGTVFGEVLDDSQEWGNYADNDKDNSRCSFMTNHFLPQSSLGTSIGCYNRNRIKILHSWSAMPYIERRLNNVLKDIQEKCRRNNILKCVEDDAKIFYFMIHDCKHLKGKNAGKTIIIRGSNSDGLKAACIFYACKKNGFTRSPKEISKMCGVKYKHVTKGCKTFIKLYKMKKEGYVFQSSSSNQFISRYCKLLNINKKYIPEVLRISENIQKLNFASMHTPSAAATASILMIVDMYGIPITRKQVAEKFDISEVTVIKTFKCVESFKHIITNNELTNELAEIIEKETIHKKMPTELLDIYDDVQKDIYDKNDNYEKKNRTFLISVPNWTGNITLKNANVIGYMNMLNNELNNKIEETNKICCRFN